MELSGIQIVTTVILIVVAGAVALFCDYLKNRAQHLRELAVELNVRQEMTAAVPAPPAPVASAASAAAARNGRTPETQPEPKPDATLPPSRAAVSSIVATSAVERHSSAAVAPALASAAEIASVRGAARARRRPVPPSDRPLPRLEDMNPREALAAWLDQRAATKAAPKPEDRPQPSTLPEAEPEVRKPLAEPVVVEAAIVPETAAAAIAVREPVAVAAEPPANDDIRDILRRALATRSKVKPTPAAPAAAAPGPVVIAEPALPVTKAEEPRTALVHVGTPDAFLWSAISAAPKKTEPPVATPRVETVQPPAQRFEVIAGAATQANSFEVTLPEGMHDYSVLERAMATGKAFRGLVISVGVSDIDGRGTTNGDATKSVSFFIRGLLSARDFACRSAEDEFLLICPGLEGAEAQRRLNQVAEQLWDYQLRGASTWSILFSWGGVDVYQQRLADAIAMATERMNQTRRGRKTVSMQTLRPRTRAAV